MIQWLFTSTYVTEIFTYLLNLFTHLNNLLTNEYSTYVTEIFESSASCVMASGSLGLSSSVPSRVDVARRVPSPSLPVTLTVVVAVTLWYGCIQGV